jgi:hypothetical protein
VKFEVRYPTGTVHQVELQGSVAVLGREPTCDLVLNDVKCSRRHAVVEAGADGMTVRDTGSANGVYVNGTKVERARLKEGDEIRLGEIVLKVLPEKVPGTVVMAPEEVREIGGPSATVAPAGRPPAAAQREPTPRPESAPPGRPARPSPAARASPPGSAAPPPLPPRPSPRVGLQRPPVPRAPLLPGRRPMALTLLSILWIVLAVVAIVGMVVGLVKLRGSSAAVVGVAAPIVAVIGAVTAIGLWTLRSWAHRLQVGLAWLGIFSPVSLGAIVTLVYMLRPESRLRFAGAGLSPEEAERDEAADLPYTFAILGGVFLSLLLTGLGFLVARSYLRPPAARNQEARAVALLRELAVAEGNFHQGTACGSYADLAGLTHPAEVIPNYRSDGPPFLRRDFDRERVTGYRLALNVEEPVSGEGCPSRSFRRFEYLATPEDADGRHFRVGPDRVVRAALGRPATAADTAVE